MDEEGLHPSSRTNREMRRAIQLSNGSIESIAREFGINPKTVAKWKHRNSVEDAPMGAEQEGQKC
jgi:transposase-like protein